MQTNVRDEVERILRRRRTELIREATGHETALREERESELEDGAQDQQLDRVLSRLDDHERREIREINAALDRIADGTYGRCIHCGRVIDIDRLAVLPETALCVRCAGALERTRAGGSPARPRQSGCVGRSGRRPE
jgi:RNA polymerase-binding transcription factor DksA